MEKDQITNILWLIITEEMYHNLNKLIRLGLGYVKSLAAYKIETFASNPAITYKITLSLLYSFQSSQTCHQH